MLNTFYRTIIINIVLTCIPFAFSQAQIAAIIPDICSPGMNVYIEIMAKSFDKGAFGNDGFYFNNASDIIRVKPLHDKDTNLLIFSPFEVSWNGRLISTHIFVPDIQAGGPNPNSDDWSLLNQDFRIPIVVSVNGILTKTDTIYIVKPFQFGDKSKDPVVNILGEGTWGKRSKRGAMIVNSMLLPKNGLITVSTKDCDPKMDGNQGYLPFILLCKDSINGNGSVISVSAQKQNGGPGGGGGAGAFCDFVNQGTNGGDGYSGGASGGTNSFIGNSYKTSGNGTLNNGLNPIGGSSITDRPGGECRAYEGGGGGTGHPFGTSGSGTYGAAGLIPGGYGAGSSPTDNEIGGGAGNRLPGASNKNNAGFIVGNSAIVPIAGGSGGGAGNPRGDCSGYGGGGGGGISIYAKSVKNLSVLSKGGDGGTNPPIGGGGSGGNIILSSRTYISGISIDIAGGTANNADGGEGRFRFDSPQFPNNAPILFPSFNAQSQESFRGPTTEELTSIDRLTATKIAYSGGDSILFFIKGRNTDWTFLQSSQNIPAKNGDTVTIPFHKTALYPDSLYFLIAIQKHAGTYSTVNDYRFEPGNIFSQAAANMFYLPLNPSIASNTVDTVTQSIECDNDRFIDSITVFNVGAGTLIIDSITLKKGNVGFSLLPISYPISILSRDSAIIQYAFSQPSSLGWNTDSMMIYSNDPNIDKNPWHISVSGNRRVNDVAFTLSNSVTIDTLQLASVCIDNKRDTTVFVFNNTSRSITLNNVTLVNNADSEFSLLSSPSKIIGSYSKDTLTIRYSPFNVGYDTAKIIVINPVCSINDTLTLISEGKSTRLSSSSSILDFQQIKVGNPIQKTVTIYNNGTTTAFIQAIQNIKPPYFLISTKPTLPTILQINDSLICTIEFNPVSDDSFFDTLVVESTPEIDACKALLNIEMNGKSTLPSLTLSLPIDTIVNPKNELYTIPIYYRIPLGDTVIADFSLSFSVNSLLFYPKSASSGVLSSEMLSNGRRLITIRITNQKLAPNDSILTLLSGIIQLDSIERDTLAWNSLSWISKRYAVDSLMNGILDLTLCEQAGKRLVHNGRELSQQLRIIPNPNNQGSTLSIQYPIDRLGEYTIELFNPSGQLLYKHCIQHSSIEQIGTEQTFSIPVRNLPIGAYAVIISNGIKRFTDRLIIIE